MKDDTLKLIGKLLPEGAGRDAVHIAVLPVVAAETLAAGKCVSIKIKDGEYVASFPLKGEWIVGIVDPYLNQLVRRGQRCFVFLYPQTITSLRHQWVHPEVPEIEEYEKGIALKVYNQLVKEHEEWLRRFAEKWQIDYDEMIEAAKVGGTWFLGTDMHSADDFDEGELDEFWGHLEKLTGKRFDREHRERMDYSCAC